MMEHFFHFEKYYLIIHGYHVQDVLKVGENKNRNDFSQPRSFGLVVVDNEQKKLKYIFNR